VLAAAYAPGAISLAAMAHAAAAATPNPAPSVPLVPGVPHHHHLQRSSATPPLDPTAATAAAPAAPAGGGTGAPAMPPPPPPAISPRAGATRSPTAAAAAVAAAGSALGALFHATATGDIAQVKALLASGMCAASEHDPTAHDTALHVLCRSCNSPASLPLLETLLHHKADPMARNRSGSVPLHNVNPAADANFLLSLASLTRLSVRDNGGWTPLHCAAAAGHLGAVHALVQSRAEVDALGDNALTPLHLAICNARIGVVEWLMSVRADPNHITASDALASVHLAAAAAREHGSISVLRLLAKANVDFAAIDSRGQTPLHLLARTPSAALPPPLLPYLLRHKCPAFARDHAGMTALELAVRHNNVAFAEQLRDLQLQLASPGELAAMLAHSPSVSPAPTSPTAAAAASAAASPSASASASASAPAPVPDAVAALDSSATAGPSSAETRAIDSAAAAADVATATAAEVPPPPTAAATGGVAPPSGPPSPGASPATERSEDRKQPSPPRTVATEAVGVGDEASSSASLPDARVDKMDIEAPLPPLDSASSARQALPPPEPTSLVSSSATSAFAALAAVAATTATPSTVEGDGGAASATTP